MEQFFIHRFDGYSKTSNKGGVQNTVEKGEYGGQMTKLTLRRREVEGQQRLSGQLI